MRFGLNLPIVLVVPVLFLVKSLLRYLFEAGALRLNHESILLFI